MQVSEDDRTVGSLSRESDGDDGDARYGAADEARRIAEEDQTVVPVLPLTAAGYAPIVGPASAGIAGPAQVSGGPLLNGAFPGAVIAAGPYASRTSSVGSDADGHLATRVEDALAEDGRMAPAVLSNIQVNAEGDGVVTLMGAAPTSSEAGLAAAIAGGVTGVSRVRNELRVDPTA